jgi:hypothetical protein
MADVCEFCGLATYCPCRSEKAAQQCGNAKPKKSS